MGLQASWVAAAVTAADGQEFARRLEDDEIFVRIDPRTEPHLFRGATISVGEVDALRTIERIVRGRKVRHIGTGSIVTDQGDLPGDGDRVFVDCTARGLPAPSRRPVFEPDRITLQYVTIGFAPWSAATVAAVEARHGDDADRNQPVPAGGLLRRRRRHPRARVHGHDRARGPDERRRGERVDRELTPQPGEGRRRAPRRPACPGGVRHHRRQHRRRPDEPGPGRRRQPADPAVQRPTPSAVFGHPGVDELAGDADARRDVGEGIGAIPAERRRSRSGPSRCRPRARWPGTRASGSAGRARAGCAGSGRRRTVTPTSSRTSRTTASSTLSPGSTKPARQLYIGTGNARPRASSTSSSRSTRTIIAGARRGKAMSPQAGQRRARSPATGSVAVPQRPQNRCGAGPLDQLHRPAGDGPARSPRVACSVNRSAGCRPRGRGGARPRRRRGPTAPARRDGPGTAARPRRSARPSGGRRQRPRAPRCPARATSAARPGGPSDGGGTVPAIQSSLMVRSSCHRRRSIGRTARRPWTGRGRGPAAAGSEVEARGGRLRMRRGCGARSGTRAQRLR